MSAFGVRADITRTLHVRYWHKADKAAAPAFVRYWTKADIGALVGRHGFPASISLLALWLRAGRERPKTARSVGRPQRRRRGNAPNVVKKSFERGFADLLRRQV
jgi:hypothetical protein